MNGVRRFESLLGSRRPDLPCTIYGVATVGVRQGIESVLAETGVRCFVADELASGDRAFAPDSDIFSTDGDRLEAESICRAIGEALEPKQPFGFDDCQSLVVFEHRCPNNTLPVFYKEGRSYQGREWVPLFPRV